MLLKKILIASLILILFGCASNDSIVKSETALQFDQPCQYMIISSSTDTRDPYVRISLFDREGNFLEEGAYESASSWDTVYSDGFIFVTGSNNLIAFDSENKRIIRVHSDYTLEDIDKDEDFAAFYLNRGLEKGQTEYMSYVCKIDFDMENSEYDKEMFECVEQVGFVPHDIMIHGDRIAVIHFEVETGKTYLYFYDRNLNLIEANPLLTEESLFLNSGDENIVLSKYEGYYITPLDLLISSDNQPDRHSFVKTYQNGYLRTNYNEDGTEIYFETLKNQEVESMLLFSVSYRLVVQDTTDSEIISLKEYKDEQEKILFYHPLTQEFLNFEYVVKENEDVLGAYYFN